MKKNNLMGNIIKIAVVVIAFSFIFELFFLGGSLPDFDFFSPVEQSANITGTTIFNGTIRTYDPILVLAANTSQPIIDELRLRPEVRDVKLETDGYIVQTETRDDVYILGQFIRSRNITAYSVANIAMPQTLFVNTSTGQINASASGVARVVTEPFLDVDSEISVYMVAVVRDEVLVGYKSAEVLAQEIAIDAPARVVALNHRIYTYIIPWESRDSLGNLSSYGDVAYDRIDSIIFTTPLSPSQIMAKKMLPYVTYIDSGSAMVSPGFANASEIASNFQDINYTLPSSTLRVMTNKTPDLQFDSTLRYSYTMQLQNPQYAFSVDSLELESEKEYVLDENLNLSIKAVVLGNKVVSIRSVGLPS